VKKSRTPLFDNAKLAAQLTAATLVPMDSRTCDQNVKAIRSDAALRLEIEVRRPPTFPA